jgi:hypothetical protein
MPDMRIGIIGAYRIDGNGGGTMMVVIVFGLGLVAYSLLAKMEEEGDNWRL